LSDYLSDKEFSKELELIKEKTRLIHERGLKVIWYIPSLEVITPNGLNRKDSFARRHPDWLQVSLDRDSIGVFYGQKVFWVAPNDESAWLCPNTPYREWFKNKLRLLTETGLDGLWLDVPVFDLIVVKWGCACPYCKAKFKKQTGFDFPKRVDVTDTSFWNFIKWRHQTLAEFLSECNDVITSANSDAICIAEVVALDHMAATLHGLEGSALSDIYVVWEVDPISDTTSMAEASYDDWTVLHNIYRYCRGATMDKPSWVFCYGYDEADAQLVLASAVAAQNNPYELRTPEMTSTIGNDFREMMFKWIKEYSKPIYHSQSIAPVAVIYSERNRDFVDATHEGGVFYATSALAKNRQWLGKKGESPQQLEYMGDYRGICLFLFQHQVPTDIFPFSRISSDLLERYRVIVLPYMASINSEEKDMLLKAVTNGTTLIISGPEPGMWDDNGNLRKQNIWHDIANLKNGTRQTVRFGRGKVHFWTDHLGRRYVDSRSEKITRQLLSWLNDGGVSGWTTKVLPVIIQPYVYNSDIYIHILNYSWVGKLYGQSKRQSLELSIPWNQKASVKSVTQSEPQWRSTKTLSHTIKSYQGQYKLHINLETGINCIIRIEKAAI